MSATIDEEITRLIKEGGVGLLPTDTIYGLSCKALDEAAVKRVHKLKSRDKGKPLVLLIADTKQLNQLGSSPDEASAALKYWPGKLTFICSAKQAPAWLSMGTDSLAVRIPDLLELRQLINKIGPIISTSVNLAGQEPATTIAQARKYFDEALDFYVDVGRLSGKPSTIVRSNAGKLEVVRRGAVTIDT